MVEGDQYVCRICGFSDEKLDEVKQHISTTNDAKHRDQSPSDPGIILGAGDEPLPREKFDVDLDEEVFRLVWTIGRNPAASRSEIGDLLGIGAGQVLSRLQRNFGATWDERHVVVEEVIPEMATNEPDDDDSEEETVKNESGNASYEGPATGIDTTTGNDARTFSDTKARNRLLEAFEGLTSKAQATILSAAADRDANRSKAAIAEPAGVHSTYLKNVIRDYHMDLVDDLNDGLDDGLITLDDLWEAAEITHENDLTSLDAFSDKEPVGPDDDGEPEPDAEDDETGQFVCPDCGAEFETANGRRVHRSRWCDASTIDDGDDGFVCENCGREFDTERGLSVHQTQHCGAEQADVACMGCGRGFGTPQALYGHVSKGGICPVTGERGIPDDGHQSEPDEEMTPQEYEQEMQSSSEQSVDELADQLEEAAMQRRLRLSKIEAQLDDLADRLDDVEDDDGITPEDVRGGTWTDTPPGLEDRVILHLDKDDAFEILSAEGVSEEVKRKVFDEVSE